MKSFKAIFLFLLLGSFLLPSCDKKGKEAEKTPYWGLNFHPGNFSINDQNITINNDVSSVNHTADYVNKEDLPDTSFQTYFIKFYLPISTDSFKIVTDSAFVKIVINGVATNIAAAATREPIKVIDDAPYVLIGITGTDSLNLGTKDNFDNVSFSLYVHYVDLAKNSDVAERQMTADLYKKE